MRAEVSGMLLGLLGVASSAAMGAELQLKVGERRALAEKAQGAALDNPEIADVHISREARVELVAKENGEATLAIYTADGKLHTHQLRVVGGEGKASGREGAGFGGERIANAHCSEPLADEGASAALQDARDLLLQEHAGEAIAQLQRALALEPDAAVVHLYLGSAWAKLKNQAKGASSYETFVLSCPDHAKAKPVMRLLREFGNRTSRAKPES